MSDVTPEVTAEITLSVGDPIEARCTKCRKNNDHVIVTMSEEAPLKVQCNICSREHKYRPPTIPKKPAVRKTLKDTERKEWEELVPAMNEAKASDYSMTDAYKLNALIKHPAFGLGVVQRLAGSQKVEVLFEGGKKIMRCK